MSAIEQPDPMARILPVTLEEYFRDPCARPSLSQSCAHTLVTRSPAHAWIEHPRFGAAPRESTKAQDEGSIIHKLILGKGTELEILEVDEYRTNYAKALRDNALAAGKIPVKAKDFEPMQAAAIAIADRLRNEHSIELDGESEVPIEWYEAGNEGWVLCRGMIDHLKRQVPVIYDLKKITSADEVTCSRHAYDYGYDIQGAAYVSAVTKLLPKFAGRIKYVPIFMEIEPPYAVVTPDPDGEMRECGQRRWQRAVEIWERCLAENRWPVYTFTQLSLPGYALAREGL